MTRTVSALSPFVMPGMWYRFRYFVKDQLEYIILRALYELIKGRAISMKVRSKYVLAVLEMQTSIQNVRAFSYGVFGMSYSNTLHSTSEH